MHKQPKVFHLLQLAHSALFRVADTIMKKEAQVSTTQLAVLFVLTRNNGVPISLIAEQLNMGNSSITGLVDRMSKLGLLIRKVDQNDARIIKVYLLPAGEDIARSNLHVVKSINLQLLAPFSQQEQEIIGRFLLHVSKNASSIVHNHHLRKTA